MRLIIYYSLVIIISLLLALCSDESSSGEKGEPFSFAFMTDIHLNFGDNNCFEGFSHAVARAESLGVDLIITGGDNVEHRFGHLKFFIFYLLSGILAAFAHLAISPDSSVPFLGASGAIAGVLGAYLLLFPLNKVKVLLIFMIIQLPALVVIGFWFILQLLSGLGSIGTTGQGGGVAYMAHVGGFVGGFILTSIFRD